MRDPRHILVLVENLSVPFDRRVWHECTTLTAAGYAVSVICPQGRRHDRDAFEERDGVRIHRYPLAYRAGGLWGYPREYGTMLYRTLGLARRVWARRPFDVIHACNPPDLFFLIGHRYRRHGVSFLFDQHDANPEIMIAKRGGVARDALPERVVRRVESATYRLADVVIAPNDSYRRLALTRGGKAEEDVFVVRSGPRRNEFSATPDGSFDRRGHRHLVAYLGVMGAQDGVDLLVRAVARLVRDGHDILLYLAGDGESYATIRHLGEELGLGERLLMPGYQTAEEFAPALLAADVCVTPDPSSPFNDISTMNKIVEYMAMARASVAFRLPENVATGGDAIAYADDLSYEGLAAAIGRLLDDEEERRRMGALARERFETVLAWEHQTPGLLAAYERLGVKTGRRWSDARGPAGAPGACGSGDARGADRSSAGGPATPGRS